MKVPWIVKAIKDFESKHDTVDIDKIEKQEKGHYVVRYKVNGLEIEADLLGTPSTHNIYTEPVNF